MSRERGSALVMALFVLVLLTGMGAGLLFLSQQEAKMGRAGLRVKKAFYLAEAAVEDGRTALFLVNGEEAFTDDLEAAAGANGDVDFDPAALEALYDPAGNVVGFTGYGDDVPIRAFTALGGPANPGWYTAFLTNDPVDGVVDTDDTNGRIMITGIGAGEDRSYEVVQAILEHFTFLPEVPAAALTLLGPDPHFDNGNSNAQSHTGDDCGVAGGPFAPIVGTVSSSANAAVQESMQRPDAFSSGSFDEEDTIGDLTDPANPIVAGAGHGTIDPLWLDCQALKKLVEFLAISADSYCNADTDSCSFPATGPSDVVFIDGDMSNSPSGEYSGILVITGELSYHGNTGWDGIILAIGEGRIIRQGGGNESPSGAVVVANIDPTPDGPAADRSDWCTTPPDGFGEAFYDVSGGGNSTVQWCTALIHGANAVRSYKVTEFLQR
jgi:hypothetical protein